MTDLEILNNPAASRWLKESLRTALQRDCVDAAADAETLATVLRDRADRILSEALPPTPANPCNRPACLIHR